MGGFVHQFNVKNNAKTLHWFNRLAFVHGILDKLLYVA